MDLDVVADSYSFDCKKYCMTARRGCSEKTGFVSSWEPGDAVGSEKS
jgi:hypothetical protein